MGLSKRSGLGFGVESHLLFEKEITLITALSPAQNARILQPCPKCPCASVNRCAT